MTTPASTPTLLVFGTGYVGEAAGREALARGWRVYGTSRRSERRDALEAAGFIAVDPSDETALAQAGVHASHILVTTPPDASGCPGLGALSHLRAADAWPDWIGYISSTSVYGDRQGGWAFEGDALNAATLEGARRVKAERDWLDSARGMGLTVQIFRLPGFYGPRSNILERLMQKRAKLVRKPDQVFNRIHIDDVVSGLFASMESPRPGGIYNLTDDKPSPADEVTEWAAARLGVPLPPEVDLDDPSVSDAMRRFYLDSKRIANARAKAELGWRPRYPSYREGLEALVPTLE